MREGLFKSRTIECVGKKMKNGNRCVFCGASGASSWASGPDYNQATKGDFDYLKCLKCGTVSLANVPADISRHYPGRYSRYRYFRKGVGGGEVAELEREKLSKVRQFVTKGRLLDAGCGEGGFLRECKAAGFECFGNEFSYDGAKASSKYGIIEQGDFMKARFENAFFDAITFWHALEHLPNPLSATSKAHSLLKKGGYLFIAVPNPASLQARFFKKSWAHLDAPRHIYLVPPAVLAQKLASQGFSVVKTDHFMTNYNAWGIGMSVLNALGARHSIAKEPNAVIKAFGVIIFSVLAWVESAFGAGGTYLLVARKQ